VRREARRRTARMARRLGAINAAQPGSPKWFRQYEEAARLAQARTGSLYRPPLLIRLTGECLSAGLAAVPALASLTLAELYLMLLIRHNGGLNRMQIEQCAPETCVDVSRPLERLVRRGLAVARPYQHRRTYYLTEAADRLSAEMLGDGSPTGAVTHLGQRSTNLAMSRRRARSELMEQRARDV